MTSDDIGCTNPAAGVIATSPATAPEMPPSALGLPCRNHSATIQPMAAEAAPRCVFTKALVASGPEESAEPALNPNQPTHSRHAPIKLNTTECGAIGRCGYPSLLPRYSAVTSALTPLVTCTTVPPAKSRHGNLPPVTFSNPPTPHTMCAIGLYTMIAHSTMNTSIAENFIRSANAPVISAGVMIANISWYTMNVCSGIVAAYAVFGATPPPRRNTLCSPPINALPVPNASEYSTNAHNTVTTAIMAKVCIIVPSTFFFRTRPP